MPSDLEEALARQARIRRYVVRGAAAWMLLFFVGVAVYFIASSQPPPKKPLPHHVQLANRIAAFERAAAMEHPVSAFLYERERACIATLRDVGRRHDIWPLDPSPEIIYRGGYRADESKRYVHPFCGFAISEPRSPGRPPQSLGGVILRLATRPGGEAVFALMQEYIAREPYTNGLRYVYQEPFFVDGKMMEPLLTYRTQGYRLYINYFGSETWKETWDKPVEVIDDDWEPRSYSRSWIDPIKPGYLEAITTGLQQLLEIISIPQTHMAHKLLQTQWEPGTMNIRTVVCAEKLIHLPREMRHLPIGTCATEGLREGTRMPWERK